MKTNTENILLTTCVIGGCAALISVVVILFLALSDFLKDFLSGVAVV